MWIPITLLILWGFSGLLLWPFVILRLPKNERGERMADLIQRGWWAIMIALIVIVVTLRVIVQQINNPIP